MRMNYFYGSQADQFNFIRIPKELVVGEAFASLSVQAKILYGMLLDRMGMSYKNKWMDEENRVYIVYSLDEIQSDMNVSQAVEAIETSFPATPERDEVILFVRNSPRGILKGYSR